MFQTRFNQAPYKERGTIQTHYTREPAFYCSFKSQDRLEKQTDGSPAGLSGEKELEAQ